MATTTGIFYPIAGKTSPIDFYVGRSVPFGGITWASQRNYGSGDDIVDTAGFISMYVACDTQAGYWNALRRAQIHFDCAAIPDNAIIQSATFSFIPYSSNNSLNIASPRTDFIIVSATCASDTQATASDYAIANYGTAPLANRITTFSLATTSSVALNSTGIAYISKTGITRFGILLGCDLDNSEPPFTWLTGYRMTFWSADAASGTSVCPKLSVVYYTPVKNVRYDSAGTSYNLLTAEATGSEQYRCYNGATVLGFSVVSDTAANASAFRCCINSGVVSALVKTAT